MRYRRTTRTILGLAASVTALAACNLGVPAQTIPVPAASVDSGDLSGDGLPDVVTVGNDTVAVHLSDGAGHVTTTTHERADEYDDFAYIDVEVLDGDLDGDLDLLVCDWYERGFQGTLRVWSNDGSGDLVRGPAVGRGCDSTSDLATGDVDGDGEDDFVQVSQAGVWVLAGAGSSTYSETQLNDVPGVAVDLADIDGDGLDDILVSHPWELTEPGVAVHLATGDGTYGPRTFYPLDPAGGWALKLRAADIDGDGALDVAAHTERDGDARDAFMSLLLGMGDGTLAPQTAAPYPIDQLAADDFSAEVDLADIDGDGALDAIVNGSSVVFSDGSSGYEADHTVVGDRDAAALDLDGDEVPDIASGGGNLHLLLNRLDGRPNH